MSGAGRTHHSRHVYSEMEAKSISERGETALFACCIDCVGNNEWRLHIPDVLHNGLNFPDDFLVLGKIPRKMHKIVWLQRGDIVQIDRKSLLDSVSETKTGTNTESVHHSCNSNRQKVASWERSGVNTATSNAPKSLSMRVPAHFVMIDRKITQQQIRQLHMRFSATSSLLKVGDLAVASTLFTETHGIKVTLETMRLLAAHNSGILLQLDESDIGPIDLCGHRQVSEKKSNNFVMGGNRSMGWNMSSSSESEYEEE